MRKVNLVVSAIVAVYLLATPFAVGQGGNPATSTKESGASSKVWVGRYAEYEVSPHCRGRSNSHARAQATHLLQTWRAGC
jgi:hypothetical protein